MKQRFTAIDIRASICDISTRIVGLRLQNFYDLGGKTFLLKFSKPDRKEYLVIESGNRFHLTDFSREKSITPSPFSLKIRKHLRARRLTAVRQIGVDRIIDLVFSTDDGGAGTYHIICEFFASGNIILTDHEFTILSILRVVKPSTIKASSSEDTKKGGKEIKKDDKKNPSSKKDKNKKNDQKEVKAELNPFSMSVKDTYDVSSFSRQFEAADISKFIAAALKADKKDTLKKVVNDVYLFGPPLTEHVLLEVGLDPSTKILDDFDIGEGSENFNKLQESLTMADQLILDFGTKPSKGFVLFNGKDSKNARNQESEQPQSEILNEFHPMLFNQHKNTPHEEYETFAKAVDYFYSVIEDQKATMRSKAQEEAAKNKLETIKKEQMGRVDGLIQSEKTNEFKAQLIEENLETVNQILMIVRSMVAAGQDWKDIQRIIEEEQRKQNYLASYIKELKLHSNMVTLQLTDPYAQYDMCDDDENDDFESHSSRSDTEYKPEYVNIDIDLSLTAYANARRYYDMKKHSKVKKEKTLAAAEQAFKSAEKKVLHDLKELKQNKPNTGVTKIRKPLWFEKFNWFISSERYLIISGRDMQQNELLVKKYLKKGDLYIHADLHGAASVIIKNPDGGPVPPGTLSQAGSMSVCYSKAWESKIVTSAWWVYDHQVSKTAPSGEYLTTGSFMIRGKKNFLPPSQLVYGFAYLFLVDETSTARHVQSRLASLKLDEEEAKPIVDNTEDLLKNDKSKDGNEETSNDKSKDDNEEAPNDLNSSDDSNDENDESGDDDNDLDSVEGDFSDIGDQTNSQVESNPNDKYGLDYIEIEESSIIQELLGSSHPQDTKITKKNAKQATSSRPPPPTSSQLKQKNQPTRAKKGKLKKIKKKYADQSDEEREIRMELLGSAKGPQPKGKKAKKLAEQRRIKEETEARRAKLRERDELNSQNAQSQLESELADEQDPKDEQGGNEQVKLEEDEEVRQLLEEENVVVLDDEEAQNLSVFDSLIPYPTEEDNILFAIPVSAPYHSLNKYKYKIKLTPGGLKKGKASKQCMDVFLQHKELLASEKDAFKNVPETEALNTILAKVKLNAPNLEAMKKSNKAKTKAKAKAK